MRVLVVDDSATIRRIIRSELEEAGYEVCEAVDGEQVLEGFMSDPAPDIMTLDVEMPRLTGFDTFKALREEPYSDHFTRPGGGSVPVIFVTSNDTVDDRRRGYSLGAADFVTKPFLKGDILSAVDKILRPRRRLEGLKALVADDSATARHIISESLQREGIDVIAVEDGKQAFEMICKQMNEIDVVITDLMMPEMDGSELCRKIRKELNMQSLPVIFLTAVPDHERLLDVFKAGATDYLVKPFVKEELLARLTVHFERSQISQRLKRAVRELRDLNEIKDSLLTICSHDLRAPLNGILGFSDLLLEKSDLEGEDRKNLEQIKNSGSFLSSLINDILDLSKIEVARSDMSVEPASLHELVEASVSAMQFLADRKNHAINVVNEWGDDLVPINGNGIMRVLNNLLSNAIKYTPENGAIEVAVRPSPPDHVALVVTDSGIGIPEDEIPYLFDKFTKVSRTGTAGEKSTGLGLSIVKEIVDSHCGRISVTSKVDGGTSFEILLPREADPASQADHEEVREEEAPCEGADPFQAPPCNILLVEDNKVNIHLAKKFLCRDGHALTCAWNGLEALEAARQQEFDIIFMDVEMPEMNGLEATRELRESCARETPIIALSGHTSEEVMDECRSAGMNDFLSKPVSAQAFNAMISKWCASRVEDRALTPA